MPVLGRLWFVMLIGWLVLGTSSTLWAATMDRWVTPLPAEAAFEKSVPPKGIGPSNMLIPFDGLSALHSGDPSVLLGLDNGLDGRGQGYGDPMTFGADPSIVSGLLGENGPRVSLPDHADPWLLVPVPAEEGLTAGQFFKHAPLPAALPLLVTGVVALYSLRRCKRRKGLDEDV